MARRTDLYVDDQGQRLPSVTEILSIAGMTDYGMVDPLVLAHAAERGQRVHEWIELEEGGFVEPGTEPDPQIAAYVSAWRLFQKETGWRPEVVEEVVRSDVYRYAGTLDQRGWLGMQAPARALLDVKCVAALQPSTALQLAGYAACLDEPHRRYALRLCPNGQYRLQQYRDRSDHHDWLSAVRVAHWKLAHGLAEIREAA